MASSTKTDIEGIVSKRMQIRDLKTRWRSLYIETSSNKDYNDELYEEMVYSALAQELISSSKAAQMLNTSIMEIEAKSQAL